MSYDSTLDNNYRISGYRIISERTTHEEAGNRLAISQSSSR
jgi:hypothetical protein